MMSPVADFPDTMTSYYCLHFAQSGPNGNLNWWDSSESKPIRPFSRPTTLTNQSDHYIPPLNEVEGTVFWFHLVTLSVCGQKRVRYVT